MGDDAKSLADAALMQILEGIGDSFYAVDGAWTITQMNEAASLFFGVGPDEVIGTELWRTFPAIEASLFGDVYRTAMTSRTLQAFRGESPTFPGKWLEVRAFPLLDGIGIAFREVTLGYQAEVRLRDQDQQLGKALRTVRDSEARYKAALTVGRMGSWESHFQTCERHWTDEGLALFGLVLPSRIGIVGGDADEYLAAVHPDDRHLIAKYRRLANEIDSFPAEYRVVRPDGRTIWVAGRGQVTERADDGTAVRLINVVSDITERKSSEEHIKILLREISHRSKNLLAVVQSIARQTGKGDIPTQEFQRRFSLRLQGLAASHDLLVSQDWRGVPLDELIRHQMVAFIGLETPRLHLQGPAVFVVPAAAQSLGLALHELGTNASKHGSLSGDEGSVHVSWSVDTIAGAGAIFQMTWTEMGGPDVQQPTAAGFGTFLLDQMVRRSLNAEVRLDFGTAGFTWTMSAPLDLMTTPSATE
ncbi:sensor histidine kinase [Phreatobacter aquaticus]|uniref:sensor histidine kinase n=1 Tax=Phreatobacter aquaticus TaxID=2570229 RepID=UPI00143D22BD|nr:HWE histidine kinase domain-containing protein [Phreatobacter aquaticus]